MFDLAPVQQVRVQDSEPAVRVDWRQISSLPPPPDLVCRLGFRAPVLGDVAHIFRRPEQLQGAEEQLVQPAHDQGRQTGEDADQRPGWHRVLPWQVPSCRVLRVSLQNHQAAGCDSQSNRSSYFQKVLTVHVAPGTASRHTLNTVSMERPHPGPACRSGTFICLTIRK